MVFIIALLTIVSMVHNVSNNIGIVDGVGVIVTVMLISFITLIAFTISVNAVPAAVVKCIRGVVPLDGPRNHRSRT